MIKLEKGNILTYCTDEKSIRLIENIKFCSLSEQEQAYLVNTEVKEQIIDYKVLRNGRLLVGGKHGFIGVYSYKEHNELLEYYDIPLEEFRLDKKEFTGIDIDEEEEEDIIVSWISSKNETALTYFKLQAQKGIFKFESVFRRNSTPFYSVKIGLKYGEIRTASAITEGKPFKFYLYGISDKTFSLIGQADLNYISCYDQHLHRGKGVYTFSGIFDKLQIVKLKYSL